MRWTILCFVLSFAVPLAAQTGNPQIAWGVNAAHQIYHLSAAGWTEIPPPANATPAQVSAAADGTVWGLDQGGRIYAYNGQGWQLVQGSLAQLSVGAPNNVWGVNGSGSIYQWNGSGWTLIENSFSRTPKQVSVGMDGTVWALDQGGNIYAYNRPGWQAVPGGLAQVSVGSANNVWGVNGGNTIYQWNGTGWTAVPSPAGATAQQVSVSADGTVYLLDSTGNIYLLNGSTWQVLPGRLIQMAAGFSDRFTYLSPSVTFQGGWSPQITADAAAGGYLQDATVNDTLTFKFTGTSVALYRPVGPAGGEAVVNVDGVTMGYIDFYFPQQRWQIPAVIDHLSPGQHTLLLTVRFGRNSASTAFNVYIDTFAAPAPFFASTDQQTALTRINFHRNPLGSATPPVPPATLNTALDLAAQAAAVYNATNVLLTHYEDPALPAFIGRGPSDRGNYFGYSASVDEDAAAVGAAASVDTWVGVVYHRIPILTYGYTDVGFGLSQMNGFTFSVLNSGKLHATTPVSRLLNTYPVNGQTNVPTYFACCEVPNPLPFGITTAGYPISLMIVQPSGVAAATSTASNTYSLTDANNNPVPIYTLDAGSDSNGVLDRNTFVMVPKQWLDANSTYHAHITGKDGQNNAFDVAWSFTTFPNATVIQSTPSYLLGFEVIAWTTAGPVTSTQLVYGTTTAYGTVAPQPTVNSGYQVSTQLAGLSPNTTYHYQITATDAQGNTFTTPDATFATPPAP